MWLVTNPEMDDSTRNALTVARQYILDGEADVTALTAVVSGNTSAIAVIDEDMWRIPVSLASGRISTSATAVDYGIQPCWLLPNGSLSRVYFSFGTLPPSWAGDEIAIRIQYHSTNTNTGTWGFRLALNSITNGDTLSSSTSTTGNSITPPGTAQVVAGYRHGTRATYAEDDHIAFSIGRAATDDHTGDIMVEAITIDNYTKITA